jgi:hypothetical protein
MSDAAQDLPAETIRDETGDSPQPVPPFLPIVMPWPDEEERVEAHAREGEEDG